MTKNTYYRNRSSLNTHNKKKLNAHMTINVDRKRHPSQHFYTFFFLHLVYYPPITLVLPLPVVTQILDHRAGPPPRSALRYGLYFSRKKKSAFFSLVDSKHPQSHVANSIINNENPKRLQQKGSITSICFEVRRQNGKRGCSCYITPYQTAVGSHEIKRSE